VQMPEAARLPLDALEKQMPAQLQKAAQLPRDALEKQVHAQRQEALKSSKAGLGKDRLANLRYVVGRGRRRCPGTGARPLP